MQGREDNCSLTARPGAVRCSAQSNTAAAMCNVMHEPQEDLHVTGSSLMALIKISHKMTLYPQLCNVRRVTDEV